MELILVVVISAGMAGNSQNGVSRSLSNPLHFASSFPFIWLVVILLAVSCADLYFAL